MNSSKSTREFLWGFALPVIQILALLVWASLWLLVLGTAPFKFRWLASVHPAIARLLARVGILIIGAVFYTIKRYDPKLFGVGELSAAAGLAWYALSPALAGMLGLKVLAAVFLTVKGIEDFKRTPDERRPAPTTHLAQNLRLSIGLPGLWHFLTGQFGVAAMILFGLLVGGIAIAYDPFWGVSLVVFVYIWAFQDGRRAALRQNQDL